MLQNLGTQESWMQVTTNLVTRQVQAHVPHGSSLPAVSDGSISRWMWHRQEACHVVSWVRECCSWMLSAVVAHT